jgi:hypothetical protein
VFVLDAVTAEKIGMAVVMLVAVALVSSGVCLFAY